MVRMVKHLGCMLGGKGCQMQKIFGQATIAYGLLAIILLFLMGLKTNYYPTMAFSVLSAGSSYLSMMLLSAGTDENDITQTWATQYNVIFMVAAIFLWLVGFALNVWS